MSKEETWKELYKEDNFNIILIFNQPLENGTTYYFHISIIKNERLLNIEIEPFEFYPKLIELIGQKEGEKIWKCIKPKIIKILDIELGTFTKLKINPNKRKFEFFEFPICALCREPKDLRKSHIIPKFIIKWIKKTSKTGKLRDSDYNRVQDSIKLFLLCEECEKKLSRFENYFAEKIFHPTVKMTSNDIKYDINLLKIIVSVSWRVLNIRIQIKREASEEIPNTLLECEKTWRKFLNNEINTISSSHYLIHSTVWEMNFMKEFKKPWKFLTERAIAHGYANYNSVDFIWCQIPFYLILSPVDNTILHGYEQCLIKENGLYNEVCAINLEKFDFIGFIFSKIDQFNKDIERNK